MARHAAVYGRVHDIRAPRDESRTHRLRDRFCRLRHRLVHRAQDEQRPDCVGGRHRRDGHEVHHYPRAGPGRRLQDWQRHDRGAHRCHAGSPQRAHQRSRLPGSGQHGELSAVEERERRAGFDCRADRRPSRERAARRRSRALHAAGDRRPARRQVRHRVGAAPGLSVRQQHRSARARAGQAGSRALQRLEHVARVDRPAGIAIAGNGSS